MQYIYVHRYYKLTNIFQRERELSRVMSLLVKSKLANQKGISQPPPQPTYKYPQVLNRTSQSRKYNCNYKVTALAVSRANQGRSNTISTAVETTRKHIGCKSSLLLDLSQLLNFQYSGPTLLRAEQLTALEGRTITALEGRVLQPMRADFGCPDSQPHSAVWRAELAKSLKVQGTSLG